LVRVEDRFEGGFKCKNHMEWYVKKVRDVMIDDFEALRY
jgi:hypothetical protein